MLDASLFLPWPFWLQHSNSWYSSNTGLNNLTCFLLSVHIMPVFNSRMSRPWAPTFIQGNWWETSWPLTTSLWSQGHALSLVGTELQSLWVSWCILINLAILMSAGSQLWTWSPVLQWTEVVQQRQLCNTKCPHDYCCADALTPLWMCPVH